MVKYHFCKAVGQQAACALSHFIFHNGSFPGHLVVFLEQLFLKAFTEGCFKNNLLAPGT